MKAWLLHDIGNIQYEEVQRPGPGEGEALVAVKAAGICGSDIPRIYRDGAHKMPLIPGHEFSGQVTAVGSEADRAWLRKRVGVFPLIPCGSCIACQKKMYEMCRRYSYLGSRRNGGFAEYAAVPVENLIELPEDVTYEQAAVLEPMAVAVHAMRRVIIAQTDRVAVCGLGTIGQLLVMFLLERGVEHILAIGNKDHQKETILALGLPEDRFCDSRQENVRDWMDSHSDGAGADVFFECVGGNDTVTQAMELTAPGGQVCLVGNPQTDIALDKHTYWKLLRNQLRVTGTWNSSFFGGADGEVCGSTDWGYALRMLEQKRIEPEKLISHRFDLAELDKGLRMMRDKSKDYLKVIVRPRVSPGC